MQGNLLRRSVAELVGTALLVFFGAGSVVAALTIGEGQLDYAGLGIISLSFGLVVALAIYALGTTSGAHINPAVTLSLASVGRFRWADVPAYLVAQLVGAFGGATLIVAVVGTRSTEQAFGRVGLTALGTDVSAFQGIVAEGAGTFLLVFTIMALAVDKRAPTGWAGFLIGLAVACEIMVIGPFTGGSVNPARSFGPYLATGVFGGSAPWGDFWVYIVGPVAGAVVAAVVYEVLVKPEREVPAPIGPVPGEPVTAAGGKPVAGVPQPRGKHEVPGGRAQGDVYAPTQEERRRPDA